MNLFKNDEPMGSTAIRKPPEENLHDPAVARRLVEFGFKHGLIRPATQRAMTDSEMSHFAHDYRRVEAAGCSLAMRFLEGKGGSR